MATVSRPAARIGWHELVAPDVTRAEAFYAELFGWTLREWHAGEQEYTMIHARGADHGGFLAEPGQAGWRLYVEVPDADAAAARAVALGGSVAAEPVDVPRVGRYVVLADPQGALFAAIAVVEEQEPPSGVFLWDELLTEDVERAKAFYGGLFGWSVEPAPRDYGFFTSGGSRVAGLMRKPREAPCSCWLGYLAADDIEAAVSRAESLGAVATLRPTPVPGYGCFAVLLDPVGAPFGLMEPEQA